MYKPQSHAYSTSTLEVVAVNEYQLLATDMYMYNKYDPPAELTPGKQGIERETSWFSLTMTSSAECNTVDIYYNTL